MSGYKVQKLPFLTDKDGNVVGVISSNGKEALFPVFSADGTGLLKADGTLFSGGGGIATITGNYAVGQTLTATYPAGTVGTIQFTRTLLAAPFTKTAISGAVASAVGSLPYTLQSADAGCNIGVDCSNQVSSATGGAVPTPPVNVYARTQAALAAVSAGTGYAKIGLVGDSTIAGARGGPSGSAIRTSTPVTFLRDQLISAQSRPTIASSWVGDQRFSVTNTISPFTFDTRLSQPDGAGYAATSGNTLITVAGSMLVNSTNAFRLGFLPEVATDTTDVYSAQATGLGSYTLTRNGGVTVNVNEAGTSGVVKTTYSSPLNSTDPIYAARVSGTNYIIGMDSYNSAIKSIRLFGLGWSGGRVADWAGTLTGFDPLNALVVLGLDLVILRCGTNDISVPGATTTSTDPTVYQANINKILDALIGAGTNVILATHFPMSPGVQPQAVQDTYAGYVRSIAATRGLQVHDTYARVGTYANAVALSQQYDQLHPNPAGYIADATVMSTLIQSLA